MTIIILAISFFMIVLTMALFYVFSTRIKKTKETRSEVDTEKRSINTLIFTLSIAFLLMAAVVIYNTRVLYKASVVAVFEAGEDKIKMTATDLDNYLTVAQTTLRICADTVDLMEKSNYSSQDVFKYLIDQTKIQAEQFDENFTGIYAYVNGEYMDGSGWEPPEDYDPESRDWYKVASEKPDEVVIISPYVDAQTGYVVVTFAKCISVDVRTGKNNVVCLDVIVNYINEVTKRTDIAGKGFGMVVNSDGFIVAHRDEAYNGKYVSETYDPEILQKIVKTRLGSFRANVDDVNCTLFVHPIMDQWYAVIVIDNDELYGGVNSQLAVNILVSLVIFFFISYFYYLGYRNERKDAQKIEDMNMRIVTALPPPLMQRIIIRAVIPSALRNMRS